MNKRTLAYGIISLLFLLALLSAVLLGPAQEEHPAQPGETAPAAVGETERPTATEPLQVTETPPQMTETPQPTEELPPLAEEWNLILVNPWNPLPEDYSVSLLQLSNGHSVDERCYPDLQDMMDACRAAGLFPLICSSYRTQETQEKLYNNQVKKWLARGYSQEEAEEQAGKEVAVPGTSEHQLGLALDIVDVNNQNLNKTQEDTAVQKWLMEHSWEYGFILRYPNDKGDVTGIIYEPWHYRYVGKDAAREIYESGLCLEEYLDQRTA